MPRGMSRVWGGILTVPAAAAGAILLLMVLGVTLGVAQRAMTGADIPGMVELTEVGLYLSAILAAPWLLRRGGHIRADLLAPSLPPAGARVLEALSNLFGLAVCLVLAVASWGAMEEARAVGSVIRRTISYPEWWLLAPLAPVFVLLAGEFALRLRAALLDPAGPRRDEARSVA